MLKNEVTEVNLYDVFERLWPEVKAELDADLLADVEQIADPGAQVQIEYPALKYPVKITSFNLDKQATLEGRLEAIKGQYLIFDSGVINIRKYAGYLVSLESE